MAQLVLHHSSLIVLSLVRRLYLYENGDRDKDTCRVYTGEGRGFLLRRKDGVQLITVESL